MKILFAFVLALFAAMMITPPDVAEAKRFGGGMRLGKQYRSMPRTPPRQTRQATPDRSQAAGAAGRTGGASRWLGPLAGLAAGGLLASLFFGDVFQGLQIMDILLVATLAFGGLMLFKAMRRGRPAVAGAGAGGAYGGGPTAGAGGSVLDRLPPSLGDPVGTDPGGADEAPDWFDGAGFLAGAKTHFIQLQRAWDQADFRDIRDYVTPELSTELERERSRLGESPQHTEVVTLEAELLAVQRDGDQVVASILFSGLIREEQNAAAAFQETWHVQHAWEDSAGDWLIAGIQPEERDQEGL